MTSPISEEVSDSRTSSVGRKRGFNKISVADDTIVNMEEDSSDNDNGPPEKRARYIEGGEVDGHQLNSTTESSLDVVISSDSAESAYSPQEYEPTVSSEDFLSNSTGNVDASSTIDRLPTRNPGDSAIIPTILTDCKDQAHLFSSQLSDDRQISACQGDDTAAASIDAPRTASPSPEQRLNVDEFGAVTATNSYSEGLVDTGSNLESRQESQRLNKHEKKLQRQLEREQKGILGSLEDETKTKTKGKRANRRSMKQAKILAHLPSSFGRPSRQKEAQEIIKSLPEASKDLMPRDIADTAYSFTEMERRFKLPQQLHKDLPVVPLSKLSFRDPLHSFVRAFLEENQSTLEVVDYGLLVRAFQEYLGLLYGHLPSRLISMVCSNKNVVGPRAENGCLKLLDDAKKEAQRKVKLNKGNHGTQAQQEKAEKAAKEAAEEHREAENTDASTELKEYNVSKQSECRILPSDTGIGLSASLDGRSCETAPNSQGSKPYSIGHLLEIKRPQSQVIDFAPADTEHNTAEKILNEAQLTGNQQPNLEVRPGTVQISGKIDAEQKPANCHTTNFDLICRYHPTHDGSPVVHYCLTCAQTTHETSDCPSLTCTSCGLHGVHFTDGCPKRQRCTRCHERGHQKSECLQKLAATADESLWCDICMSSKHLEPACHFLWRSFKPSMLKNTKFAANIPIYCYCCGAMGHFGSECGIRRSPLNTEGYSWSIINWKRYVDPHNHNLILPAGQDFKMPLSAKGKKNFNIKGTAQNRTMAATDEDEDIPFIREKVTKAMRAVPKGNQRIKFDQNRSQDNDYIFRPHLGPPPPESRYQSSRISQPDSQQKAYAENRREFSYRSLNDPARYMHERSFSSPPSFHEERYALRSGDNYFRMDETIDSYRNYDRGISNSNVPAKALGGRDSHNQGPSRGGSAQGGRGGAVATRGKRQRNRMG